jgi:hypothetical protein
LEAVDTQQIIDDTSGTGNIKAIVWIQDKEFM